MTPATAIQLFPTQGLFDSVGTLDCIRKPASIKLFFRSFQELATGRESGSMVAGPFGSSFPLDKSHHIVQPVSERMFDVRTEVGMGEWAHVGPEGTRAYRAVPDGGTGPGVLVLHAWWGLTPVFTDVCDRLAAEGFVALAPSLYPDGATTASISEAEKLVEAHDSAPDVARAIIQAATEHLVAMPEATGERIGVIGFSMGAYWALNLSQARPDDISAVVAFYGTDDGDYGASRAAYLGHFAEHDDFEPLEGVRALEDRIRAAGHEVELHVYPGTGHWFVEPDRPDAYNAAAEELVWERTLAFLNAQLS